MSGIASLPARLVVDRGYYTALRRFPSLAPALGRMAASCLFASSPGLRTVARENARLALGPDTTEAEVDRVARAMVGNMQRTIAETLLAERASPDELAARVLRFSGQDGYHRVRDPGRVVGRGLLVASIHMGAFEPCLALLRRFEPRIHVLFHPDPMPGFERARQRLRQSLGIIEHPVTGGVQAWMSLHEALGRGEVVVLHADRTMPDQRGSVMRFLGVEDALLPTGPVRLALACGVPIVPIYCSRIEGGLAVDMDQPIECGTESLRGDAVARHPAQAALVASMERAIRARPEEWMAFGRVRRPSG
jgi:lauroyl/myristoyl acyltransferase